MTTLQELSAPVTLERGGTYFAKIQLTGLEATFGTSGAVRAKLEAIGFDHVSVWSDAPAVFPDKEHFPDGATFFATGTWEKDAITKSLPGQVKRVWVDADTLHAAAEPPPGPQVPPVEVAPTEPAPAPHPEPLHSAQDEEDEEVWLWLGLALLWWHAARR